MKLYGMLCIAVAIILLTAPMASVKTEFTGLTDITEDTSHEDIAAENTALKNDGYDRDTISVFMTGTGNSEKMDIRDYIIGAVAAEMPASYEEEALKAQALAAVTFAEYLKRNGGDENAYGADISDDSSVHQGYMSVDEMKEKWGDAYESYYEKIENAVDDVLNEIITYDGEPIVAAYHAISPGQTEDAENIWGYEVPYLKSAESEGDKYSTRYSSEVSFTAEEIAAAVNVTDYKGDEADIIKINSASSAGTVLNVTVCGKEMTGMELRNLLALKSPSFRVEYDEGVFTFFVSGYGHGVGMSQYGADYYASQGMTYEEIIAHYYPGTEIEKR